MGDRSNKFKDQLNRLRILDIEIESLRLQIIAAEWRRRLDEAAKKASHG